MYSGCISASFSFFFDFLFSHLFSSMSGFYEGLDLYLILYTMYQFYANEAFLTESCYCHGIQRLFTDKVCPLLCATKGETDLLATKQCVNMTR